MTEPKIGDRVKVEYEGIVRRVTSSFTVPGGDELVRIELSDGSSRTTRASLVTVIEPIYVPGEVYQAADGLKWLRLRGPNILWRPLDTNRFLPRQQDVGHDFPKRPLVKLVPEK